MAKMVTPDAISTILANPSPDSFSDLPEIIVQVVDLKPTGNRYMFSASDGKMKIKGILQSSLSSEVISGSIQNLGLIRILDYTLNDIPTKNEKYLIVTKCEAVSPALEEEYKAEMKTQENDIVLKPKQENFKNDIKMEETGIVLKPKQEIQTKSAAQIVHEQHGNMAPAARMAMTRRIQPLVSLNPYQGNWTIKVRVTSKGNMRTYKNARGEGCVFNVELTDEDGTQIQATMFNEAARKFFDKFELGKVYYISKGTLKVANKQFKTVQNDYEMTLNENSQVEEASNEEAFIPETKFNFVPIDELGPYVNGRELVDIIGVVQSVSPTMSIRRKSNNEMVPKRDITIADETKKTVVVSLWNDLATNVGQELLDMSDKSPVVAIKSLKVGDFQGVSLSALSKSNIVVNPDLPEAKKLRSWYDSEGKETSLASIGSGMSPSTKNGARSMYSDRVSLLHITSNPSLGEEKPVFFSIKAYISFIKPDQTMWYRACKACNKKVTDAFGSGYWCEGCQKNDAECSLRYIMALKVSDASGEAWLSAFNEQAEKILGCSADELDKLKSEEGETAYQMKLKEATWVPHLFRVSVAPQEYNSEKRQRITVRAVAPVDYAAESKYLLEEMSKMNISI
ncbi:PREDICTED: replication protein A 70 kDa DNA-binding subunit B [Nicotiana attenuata]|uniref:Replication protein A subunit n=1 Tax=Nicotiana attenuata TaxID=49451 RepID=A0A1J6IWL2_NICAT|nr:PREDICTED: replication protein A 70 kDa DNA-binding subunit B [Nicotiana attenuata]OIT04976.1 replication protein a 70 kda dna-binding subunit d [Nicotiana attenuata]